MSVKNDGLSINLKLCLVLAALLLLLGILSFLPLPWADWRLKAGVFAVQCVFAAMLAYYVKDILHNGRQALFGGIPAMEGLAFAGTAAGFIGSFVVGINALYGGLNIAALLFAPVGIMLVMLLCAVYCREKGGLLANEKLAAENLTVDKTAAFMLPIVFALALAAALSCWFYGLGAATACQVLGCVLLASGAGVFALADVLPEYFAMFKAQKQGYSFKDAASAANSRRVTMAVFDDSFAQDGSREVSDVIGIGISEVRLLALTASVTAAVKEPLAELFKKQAAGMELPVCYSAVKMHGGISAKCEGKNIRIGRLDFVNSVADIPKKYALMQQKFDAQGKNTFYITGGRQLLGIIAIGQTVNASLLPVLKGLQKAGVRTVMFSSAGKQATEYIGSKAGFDKTVAELSAEHQKDLTDAFCRAGEFIAELKPCAAGVEVTFYGNAANNLGGLILTDGNLHNLAQAIKLSKRLQKIHRQNNKLALGLSAICLLMVCGWLLMYKTAFPGTALALMLIVSAFVVWLNSRRL